MQAVPSRALLAKRRGTGIESSLLAFEVRSRRPHGLYRVMLDDRESRKKLCGRVRLSRRELDEPTVGYVQRTVENLANLEWCNSRRGHSGKHSNRRGSEQRRRSGEGRLTHGALVYIADSGQCRGGYHAVKVGHGRGGYERNDESAGRCSRRRTLREPREATWYVGA